MAQIAGELARALAPRDCVLLEGELGAGKSTFARQLLENLGVLQLPEGSPTFAIAHEYSSPRMSEIIHADLYRIQSSEELEDAGIWAYLSERDACVFLEWATLWPEIEQSLKETHRRLWKVKLSIPSGEVAVTSRVLEIWGPGPPASL